MKRVLVANRGEIARRVIATCHRLGLSTVAVCSDPDISALHVLEADAAVRLPGSRASDTYLRADLLVDAALRSGADAVHPGYGFLSENADFARAVIDAGLTWIGPSPDVIATMGSKIEAKKLASAAGVPVLAELDEVRAADLPVLVKASAGGGGRGMRVVRSLADLPGALEAARAEAAAAFGDPAVFVEPLIEDAHHVEVQVFGTLVLGERECSVQRRHQKVIEEAPSPLVERVDGMRDSLYSAASALASAVGYTGAGTVEFLAAPDGRFWFLEMNTRLQVEHPVTECTTGLDLVELQLGGGAAPASTPVAMGWAIEARLYAEDPAAGWAPSVGELRLLDVAATHPAFTPPGLTGTPRGVRLDSGVSDGSVIGVHYDPMLAKVIAWAPTRAEAAGLLARTLTRARIHGLRTNRDLLVRVLRHPSFTHGSADTGFLERALQQSMTHRHRSIGVDESSTDLYTPLVSGGDERLGAVAAAIAGTAERREAAPVLGAIPSGWRNVPTVPQRTVLAGPSGEHVIEYRGTNVEGVTILEAAQDRVTLEANGVIRRWQVTRYDDRFEVDGDTGSVTFTEVPRFPQAVQTGSEGSLRAPLPGTVVEVHVSVGDEVSADQPLLVLEAMKMQHVVRADRAGRVEALFVQTGSTVEVGAVLAEVHP